MLQKKRLVWLVWLVFGDIVCALVVSLLGFFTHYGKIEGWRWLSTFLPVCLGWILIAPWLGVYQEANHKKPVQVWRAVLAALISAPLAATVRGAWLNSPVLPLFVLILGLTDALGFLVWRIVWILIVGRKMSHG